MNVVHADISTINDVLNVSNNFRLQLLNVSKTYGLSSVSKVAPKHLQGICQGLWLSATAIGNLFIAMGVTMLNKFPHQWQCWAVFAGFCLVSMCVMLGMVKWLERVTK